MEDTRNISQVDNSDQNCVGELGCLALFKNITDEDMELFIDLVTNDFSPFLRVLYNIVGDKNKILRILDAFEGQRIYFQDRKKFYKTLEKVTIYNYIKNHNYAPEAYSSMSKQFQKRVSQLRNIVDRINALKSGEPYKFVGSGGDSDE